MVRVVTRSCAAREYEIVARALALGAKPTRGRPHERMEPIEDAGETAKRVADEIAPLHVRELVEEDRATPAVAPALRTRGQNDCRLHDATCKWHLDERAREKPRHGIEIEAIGDLAQWRGPGPLTELTPGLHDATHRQRAKAEPAEEAKRDCAIRQEE